MKILHKCRISVLLIALIFCIGLCAGCSMKTGTFSEQTHFSFPNSNVKPLGEVRATKSKTSFVFPPTITAIDVRDLMDDALAQKPGADLIINYKTDTKITMFPILPPFTIYSLNMTLTGTAASMEVGRQELQEQIDQLPKY